LLRFKLKKVGFVEIGNKHLILSSKSKPGSIDLISLDKVIRSLADFNDANISVFQKDKNVVLSLEY
jgi:diaminopimelate epimerase